MRQARRRVAARTVSSRATASNDAGTVRSTSCSASGASGCAWSHAARRCGRGSAPRPRPARPWAPRPAPATAGAAPPIDAGVAQPRLGRRDQPRRHLPAVVARELADDAGAARSAPHGSASVPGGTRRRPAGRGTTAAAAAARRRRARRAAAIGEHLERRRRRLRCRRRRPPSWWCRDRCRRRSGRRSARVTQQARPPPARPRVGSVPRGGAGSVTLAMRQPWWRKRAGERRLADDVADQPDARRDRTRDRRAPGRSPASRSTGSSGRCSASAFLQPRWMSRTAAPICASE